MRSIDAVITWVDGSDEDYKKKIENHLTTSTNYKKQYLQANEIEYCVKSILKFAVEEQKKENSNIDSKSSKDSKEKEDKKD